MGVIRWVKSPCKDCTERKIACHDHCEKFLEYRKKHLAEKERMYQEDKLKGQISQINYESYMKRQKNKGPLKHGRRK